jgi:hypothetical protein
MAIIWVSIPTGKEQMSLITQTPWLCHLRLSVRFHHLVMSKLEFNSPCIFNDFCLSLYCCVSIEYDYLKLKTNWRNKNGSQSWN